MDFLIRPAVTEDAVAAADVLRRSIVECCAEDHRNDPAVLQAWLKNKTPENLRRWFTQSHTLAVVAERGSVIVGVSLLTGSGELALCYLVPEARFKGVGRAMVSTLETSARNNGLMSIHLLSTRTGRGFYLRNGFGHRGEPETVFGIEAWPMQKQLKEEL